MKKKDQLYDREESYEEYEKGLEEMDFCRVHDEDKNIRSLIAKAEHYKMYMKHRCYWCGKRTRLVPGKEGNSGLYQCPECKSLRWVMNE